MTKKNIQHLNQFRPFLLQFKNSNRAYKKKILKKAKIKEIKCICEILKNVLNQNLPITSDRLLKIKQYKKCLRKLTGKGMSIKKRRHFLLQKGNGLPGLLLTSILPLAIDLLLNSLKKS